MKKQNLLDIAAQFSAYEVRYCDAEVFEIIKQFREVGKTVLLVEQNAKKAMSISDRAYVLENGVITMSGDAHELAEDERVRKAYLGA